MFPAFAEVARLLRPRAILIENVKGILRPSFNATFEYILLMLRYPDIIRKSGQSWTEHLDDLKSHHEVGKRSGLYYNLDFRCLNATDFGVPQRRERVFIVGFRGDLDVDWSFPTPTHSLDSLLRSKWVTGDYWHRHRIATQDRPELEPRIARRLERIRGWFDIPSDAPWRTVRDAIADLPDPRKGDHSLSIPNHWLNPGARVYPGHNGSPLDEPAKVLKAGDHGVPGGENMLAYHDGEVRYFTVRECARLQTFPDEYVFMGSWTESMRQLGNAVPMQLAEVIATSIHTRLKRLRSSKRHSKSISQVNGIHRNNGEGAIVNKIEAAPAVSTRAGRRQRHHA
jgi:DNA (cytosine-5)-methyltransferase 1